MIKNDIQREENSSQRSVCVVWVVRSYFRVQCSPGDEILYVYKVNHAILGPNMKNMVKWSNTGSAYRKMTSIRRSTLILPFFKWCRMMCWGKALSWSKVSLIWCAEVSPDIWSPGTWRHRSAACLRSWWTYPEWLAVRSVSSLCWTVLTCWPHPASSYGCPSA